MSETPRSEISQLLSANDSCQELPRNVLDRIFALLYAELLQLGVDLMKTERAGHTLQPAALVSEAYLRLADGDRISIHGRTHFFGIAAGAMRRILVEHARKRGALKRGAGWKRISLAGCDEVCGQADPDVIDLDDALNRLAVLDPRLEKIVEWRVFAGLPMEEIASLLGVSRETATKYWAIARMWLHRHFAEGTA